ncbi:U3 small nucleolar RNA-associated protein 25 [Dillenia turbinata]|uniref:U3 small nucleolar RNA-associated protein 25 n=1 Tax=Dillenia turbinata TaxID=194707 RepID=A0AAN8V2H2_9MAGN
MDRIMNHIFKTRDLVMKNDAKMAKHQETAKEQDLAGESFLDQGFTRPKAGFYFGSDRVKKSPSGFVGSNVDVVDVT